jgi:hypothetical protein
LGKNTLLEATTVEPKSWLGKLLPQRMQNVFLCLTLGTPYPLLAQGFRATHAGGRSCAWVSPSATAMLPPAIYRLLIAPANPVANCGIYILKRNAAPVPREVLCWMIQICFIIYEPDYHL